MMPTEWWVMRWQGGEVVIGGEMVRRGQGTSWMNKSMMCVQVVSEVSLIVFTTAWTESTLEDDGNGGRSVGLF
jgi:hypothetical protein